MPRSGILDASVGQMFTKYACIKCIGDRFFIIQNTAIMEESDDNFEHFDLLITCLIIP